MKRLIEQTACPECEIFHDEPYASPEGTPFPDIITCPGGSSREVTVDIEAGAKALHAIEQLREWSEASDGARSAFVRRATVTVDAALGGGL